MTRRGYLRAYTAAAREVVEDKPTGSTVADTYGSCRHRCSRERPFHYPPRCAAVRNFHRNQR